MKNSDTGTVALTPWAVGPRHRLLHGLSILGPWLGGTAGIFTIESFNPYSQTFPPWIIFALTSPLALVTAILVLQRRDSHRLLGLGLATASTAWFVMWSCAKLGLGKNYTVLPMLQYALLTAGGSFLAAVYSLALLIWDTKKTLALKAAASLDSARIQDPQNPVTEWSTQIERDQASAIHLKTSQIRHMKWVCMAPTFIWGIFLFLRLIFDANYRIATIDLPWLILPGMLWTILLISIWRKNAAMTALGSGAHLLSALFGIPAGIVSIFGGLVFMLIERDGALIGVFWLVVGLVMGILSYMTSHRAWYLVQLSLNEALSIPRLQPKPPKDDDSDLYGAGNWDEGRHTTGAEKN